MEAVKTMIHDQDLPMHLWVEAKRTTMYVQNILFHNALGFKTLEEMYTGKKPEVSHLNIFGCPVYGHIPKYKRTKFDPSRKKGIFVGYYEVYKYSKCWIFIIQASIILGCLTERITSTSIKHKRQ